MNVVHQGRGGYIEIEGYRYHIEHVEGGSFCVYFPCGNRHSRLEAHFALLTELADAQQPTWFVEDRRRKPGAQ